MAEEKGFHATVASAMDSLKKENDGGSFHSAVDAAKNQAVKAPQTDGDFHKTVAEGKNQAKK